MKTKDININGQQLTIKVGMKSYMIFESITERPFQIRNTSDLMCLIYASILAGSPDCRLKFDDMLDWLDENPEQMNELTDFITGKSSLDDVKSKEGDDTEKKA